MKSKNCIIKGLFGSLICWISLGITGQALAQWGMWGYRSPMPTARHSINDQAVAIGGKLYVAGGHDGLRDTPVLEAYDPATDTWSTLAPLPHWDSGNDGRYSGSAGVIDGKLYLAGGWRTSPPLPTSTLQIYDPFTDTWSRGADMPLLSAGSIAGVIDRKLYVLTAYDGYSGVRKRLHVYNPDTDSWTEKSQPNSYHGDGAGGVINGRFYVVGGYDGSNEVAALEVYDPASDSWSVLAPMPMARTGVAIGVMNGKLYVVGGADDPVYFDRMDVYDSFTDSWTTEAPIPTAVLTAAGGFIGGKFFVAGGRDGSSPQAKLQVFSPLTTIGGLPDTGQTKCYDNTVEITCPQSWEYIYGQDAQYTINPPSYTKLDASGNDLPDDATSWVMVHENVTGLIWSNETRLVWRGNSPVTFIRLERRT